MDRAHYDSKTSSKLRITGRIIELNDVIWSIQNLVAIAITKKIIQFNDPPPIFDEPKPILEFPIKNLVILCIILIGFALYSLLLFCFLLLASVILIFFINNQKKNEIVQLTNEWNSRYDIFNEQFKIWEYKKNNPKILYGLVLETCAASRSIIYSFDFQRIKEAHSTIKSSMNEKDTIETFISIDTVNVGGDSATNNFDSSIINQSINEGKWEQ